jgi:hypothetical protein
MAEVTLGFSNPFARDSRDPAMSSINRRIALRVPLRREGEGDVDQQGCADDGVSLIVGFDRQDEWPTEDFIDGYQ